VCFGFIILGEVKVLPDEGMPIYKKPFERGRLIVKFRVKFPEPQDITPEIAQVRVDSVHKQIN
jgi:DnaJ-class molecular chaperone